MSAVTVRDLDENVVKRLRAKAGAAGLSMEAYLRVELARISLRPGAAEYAALVARNEGIVPVSAEEFATLDARRRSRFAALAAQLTLRS